MSEQKLHLLTVVVQRKLGAKVLDVALKAGADGATYFYAQGTGVRQKLGLLGAFIDSEKQVIMIVAEPQCAAAVLKAVTEAASLDEPGKGFAYVQEVSQAVGFFKSPAAL